MARTPQWPPGRTAGPHNDRSVGVEDGPRRIGHRTSNIIDIKARSNKNSCYDSHIVDPLREGRRPDVGYSDPGRPAAPRLDGTPTGRARWCIARHDHRRRGRPAGRCHRYGLRGSDARRCAAVLRERRCTRDIRRLETSRVGVAADCGTTTSGGR